MRETPKEVSEGSAGLSAGHELVEGGGDGAGGEGVSHGLLRAEAGNGHPPSVVVAVLVEDVHVGVAR